MLCARMWLLPAIAWAAGEPSMPSMPTSGAPGPGGPSQWWMHWQLVAALVVIILAVILWLVGRATHSRYLKPGWVSGVALLLCAYFVTSFAVTAFRKPGQLPLLESATMDMSAMQASPGAVPVATEIVKPRDFAPAVTYTGTVVALNDEDVYPRVSGTIVSLPVYPGDRVTPGQLLVRLDDAELSARERGALWDREMAARATRTAQREEEMAAEGRRQAEAEVTKAQQDLKVMQREVVAADAMVKQAESEVAQARHSVEAGEKEIEAAQAAQEQAQAEASMASAGIEVAQADVASAKADVTYWEQEIKRAKQLLGVGAYSTDEYQREESQHETAKAKLSQAQAMVNEKKQALAAAQAAIKQSTATIAGSQARLSAMQAEVDKAQAGLEKARADKATAQAQVESGQAMVRSAQAMRDEKTAGVRASTARVAEAAAAVPQRAAALTVARTVRGYTEIRAQQPGQVIQRLVSPGVLVNPGTVILRIAQIDRVRLQAYVSPKDLVQIAVGSPVEAGSPKLPGGVLRARVTSIFPASDPTTRTCTVEALVENPRHKLYPGDAITLKLMAQTRGRALTVPSSAIVYRTVATGGPSSRQEATVWLAAPEKAPTGPASKHAHQVVVALGPTDGERTRVVSGLREGDEVIYRGIESLQEGFVVYPVLWSDRGPAELPPAPMSSGQGTSPPPAPSHSGHKM